MSLSAKYCDLVDDSCYGLQGRINGSTQHSIKLASHPSLHAFKVWHRMAENAVQHTISMTECFLVHHFYRLLVACDRRSCSLLFAAV